MSHWIWLPEEKYPENQCCVITLMNDYSCADFCVAQFCRSYSFEREIAYLRLKTGGDTVFRLSLNGKVIENGPVCVGGDWIDIGKAPYYYTQEYEVGASGKDLSFDALVQLGATVTSDYSCGHGGFFLEAEVHFTDGTSKKIGTDEGWLCRLDRRYVSQLIYDGTVLQDEFVNAVYDSTSRSLKTAEIPLMSNERVIPDNNAICVLPGEIKTECFNFDSIYAAYLSFETDGDVKIGAMWYEKSDQTNENDTYSLTFSGETHFETMRLKSVGGVKLTVENISDKPVTVKFSIVESHFPIDKQGSFICSDDGLNRLYELCRRTLRACRQTIHLDSVKHQEMLACTGDYLIETKMTEFTFGDMRLARFDVKRTADWLVANNGVLFHTTYSLLWVEMLYEVYMFTGDIGLLEYCRPAMKLLFERFSEYTGDNGLVEKAPNYMFVDWLDIEGFNLHHPPKYLGQAALCMFYYGALCTAVKIYSVLGDIETADILCKRAENLKKAVNTLLYDGDRRLYFDGLPTKNEIPANDWLPENADRRHYSRHINVLAALYGVCENSDELLVRTLEADDLPDMQPYFMHYALSAIGKCDMFQKYGFPILERFKELEKECSLGLKEGWIATADYPFDYSHAWGGTPAYQLPSNMLGFKMIKPGFKEISLSPRLFGLKFAEISMPTPYGAIHCNLRQGHVPVITVPPEIKYTVLREDIDI